MRPDCTPRAATSRLRLRSPTEWRLDTIIAVSALTTHADAAPASGSLRESVALSRRARTARIERDALVDVHRRAALGKEDRQLIRVLSLLDDRAELPAEVLVGAAIADVDGAEEGGGAMIAQQRGVDRDVAAALAPVRFEVVRVRRQDRVERASVSVTSKEQRRTASMRRPARMPRRAAATAR